MLAGGGKPAEMAMYQMLQQQRSCSVARSGSNQNKSRLQNTAGVTFKVRSKKATSIIACRLLEHCRIPFLVLVVLGHCV